MHRVRPYALGSLLFVLTAAIAFAVKEDDGKPLPLSSLRVAMKKVRPLHAPISKPGPSDWLAQHKEPGQTFAQYVVSNPVIPQGARTIIYIQPIGDFTRTQKNIVGLTADYFKIYFGLQVKTLKPLPLSSIPDRARRTHPTWGGEQILTTYVLHHVLKPRLPKDAAAMIALTATDLWPGKGWNFVFGQASIRDRVGVWSIYRNGNPDGGAKAFRLCLRRTLKTAVHETGHMFSMLHCTAYECCMCGSNHREESDRRPLYLCPECMAKVCWATRVDPVVRYQRLLAFCRENELKEEAIFFQKSLHALHEGF